MTDQPIDIVSTDRFTTISTGVGYELTGPAPIARDEAPPLEPDRILILWEWSILRLGWALLNVTVFGPRGPVNSSEPRDRMFFGSTDMDTVHPEAPQWIHDFVSRSKAELPPLAVTTWDGQVVKVAATSEVPTVPTYE